MSKKSKNETQVEGDSLTPAEIARAKRKATHEEKNLLEVKKEDSEEEFRKFFAQKRVSLNLNPSLEGVIWLHFKAYKFDKKDKFSDGLKHFGIGE